MKALLLAMCLLPTAATATTLHGYFVSIVEEDDETALVANVGVGLTRSDCIALRDHINRLGGHSVCFSDLDQPE